MSNTTCDVLGIGENSVDYVYRLPEYPQTAGSGAKLQITSQMVSPGGQVATALCTCASMGLRAKYVGTFGNDDSGARIRSELTGRGIDISGAFTRKAPNRYAVILVDQRHGERIVLWHRDPALAIQPEELGPALVSGARVLHVDDVDEEVAIRAAQMARAAGVQHVTSDIDRCTGRTEALVAAVTIPIFAEHVPPALTGEPDPERALRALRRRHDGWLCVTLGARGSLLLDGDRLHESPGLPVEVVDTTGAGDVFRGAFIAALLRGNPPAEILRFACAAAALSCTRHGAIGGVPSLEEVERILAR